MVVVILLDPAASLLSIIIRKAHHVAGQRIVRINPPVLLLKPDALDPVPASRRGVGLVHLIRLGLKRLLLVHGKLLFIRNIIGIRVFIDQIRNFRPIVSKYLTEGRHRRLQVIVPALIDLIGIDDQVIDHLAGGKIGSVPVHDVSPSVGQRPAVIGGMLAQDDLGIILVVFLYHLV